MNNAALSANEETDMPGAVGYWVGNVADMSFAAVDGSRSPSLVRAPVHIVYDARQKRVGLAHSGRIRSTPTGESAELPVLASLPALYPEWLGDRSFQETHGLRFAYVGGAMARGIASTELVIALARMGALGMFGAAGLRSDVVEQAIDTMGAALDGDGLSWGCNLIHSPNEPELEEAIVDLYLRRNVRRVSASAYMGLTSAVVRYACTGLTRDASGQIQRRNFLFAKISREEVAAHFLSPPPTDVTGQLVRDGLLSQEEADLAAQLPLAEDIIVESDSGGHTDNRPLNSLLPAIMLLRDRIMAEQHYSRPVRLGAAGSLGTPGGVAAAFGLGASFVLVGSVHQACIESGISARARDLLAEASLTDVMMTASADMFELGVEVQVLKRGTMMGVRGNQLYDVYSRYDAIESIPDDIRTGLEKNIFRTSLDEIWAETEQFFERTDPAQLAKAAKSPKHKMALIFRWYIGNSSQWPIAGTEDRQGDYQIWCGPAMGAFNSWVRGSFLEPTENRVVQQVALNLLEGATLFTRVQQLRSYGVEVDSAAFHYQPVPLRIQQGIQQENK